MPFFGLADYAIGCVLALWLFIYLAWCVYVGIRHRSRRVEDSSGAHEDGCHAHSPAIPAGGRAIAGAEEDHWRPGLSFPEPPQIEGLHVDPDNQPRLGAHGIWWPVQRPWVPGDGIHCIA